MAKNNIRSIRFSDELAELIDRQVGNTFTEKFENLITKCVWELPQKQQQLENLARMITEKRKELDRLRNLALKLQRRLTEISGKVETLGSAIDQTITEIES